MRFGWILSWVRQHNGTILRPEVGVIKMTITEPLLLEVEGTNLEECCTWLQTQLDAYLRNPKYFTYAKGTYLLPSVIQLRQNKQDEADDESDKARDAQ